MFGSKSILRTLGFLILQTFTGALAIGVGGTVPGSGNAGTPAPAISVEHWVQSAGNRSIASLRCVGVSW